LSFLFSTQWVNAATILLPRHNTWSLGFSDATGKTYSRKLEQDDSAKAVAGRLTKEFRLVLLGKTNSAAGFSRPIQYPKSGIV
jgi:hypothetical protein